jgi:hypothetical protein
VANGERQKCPFCGGEADLWENTSPAQPKYFGCPGCFIAGQGSTEEEAKTDWLELSRNHTAKSSDLLSEVERLKEKVGAQKDHIVEDSLIIETLKEDVISLRVVVGQQTVALKEVEWIETGSGLGCYCPSCGGGKELGHRKDCQSQNAIKAGEDVLKLWIKSVS